MPDYLPMEWPLRICKAKEAWDLPLPSHGFGKAKGEGVVIFHPDTGWTDHPEVAVARYLRDDYRVAKNFLISPPSDSSHWEHAPSGRQLRLAKDPLDHVPLVLQPGHGTSTASLMMSAEGHPNDGTWNNPRFENYKEPELNYITGIAPKVQVIPCRVCRSVVLELNYMWFKNSISNLREAIHHAIKLQEENYNIGVISISLGARGENRQLTNALKDARRAGIVICAAGGQFINTYGIVDPVFPGQSPHVIGVAGCDESLAAPSDAFYGLNMDITAPGWSVTVARSLDSPPYYTVAPSSGTSYSTALIAGACALWQAYHNRSLLIKKYGRPFLHNVFKYVLQVSSKKDIPGWDSALRGAGVLDVEALLKMQLPEVDFIERNASDNGWGSPDWGDPSKWGRE